MIWAVMVGKGRKTLWSGDWGSCWAAETRDKMCYFTTWPWAHPERTPMFPKQLMANYQECMHDRWQELDISLVRPPCSRDEELEPEWGKSLAQDIWLIDGRLRWKLDFDARWRTPFSCVSVVLGAWVWEGFLVNWPWQNIPLLIQRHSKHLHS